MTAFTLICENVTVRSVNSSLISVWLTTDVSPKPLPTTLSSFRLSTVATLIASSSNGFSLIAAGLGASASLVDQSSVSLANMTMSQYSACSSRTLATNNRVTFSETTPISVGCDVKCDDGTSVLCNAHRWLGDVANSITRVTITDARVVYEILNWVGLVTSLGERAPLTPIHHATTNATKQLCNRSVVTIEHSKPSATIVTNAQREHLKELVQVICRRPPVI